MIEIRTGLFYNFSESFMKMPTSIIQIRHSDRQGIRKNLYSISYIGSLWYVTQEKKIEWLIRWV